MSHLGDLYRCFPEDLFCPSLVLSGVLGICSYQISDPQISKNFSSKVRKRIKDIFNLEKIDTSDVKVGDQNFGYMLIPYDYVKDTSNSPNLLKYVSQDKKYSIKTKL